MFILSLLKFFEVINQN